jgi:hypothetical protein
MLTEMLMTRLRTAAAMLIAALVGIGATVFGYRALAEVPAEVVQVPTYRALAEAPEEGIQVPALEEKPKRLTPTVLGPVEFQADFLRARVRQYLLADDPQGKGLQVGVLVPPAEMGGPYKVKFVEPGKVPAGATLAEITVPQHMIILSGSFPYRQQLENFRDALQLRSLTELAARPELLPKFMDYQARRRTVNENGQVVHDWAELDLKAWTSVLGSAVTFGPTESGLKEMQPLIFPGLVVSLPSLARDTYPPVRLRTLDQTLRKLAEGKDALDAAKDEKAFRIPDYCLVRFVDVTIQSGLIYQYQFRVRLANPNHGKKESVAYPELAKKVLSHEWCPEKPITVTVPADK